MLPLFHSPQLTSLNLIPDASNSSKFASINRCAWCLLWFSSVSIRPKQLLGHPWFCRYSWMSWFCQLRKHVHWTTFLVSIAFQPISLFIVLRSFTHEYEWKSIVIAKKMIELNMLLEISSNFFSITKIFSLLMNNFFHFLYSQWNYSTRRIFQSTTRTNCQPN